MSLEQTIIDIKKKLDKIGNPEPFWGNAEEVMRLTGWDSNTMFLMRKLNKGWFRLNKKGGYEYDLNKIPGVVKKQTA